MSEVFVLCAMPCPACRCVTLCSDMRQIVTLCGTPGCAGQAVRLELILSYFFGESKRKGVSLGYQGCCV